MIISQDGKTAVVDVKEAQLLNAGADTLLVVNGKTMGKFKNKKFAESVFQQMLTFCFARSTGATDPRYFDIPADF